MKRDTVKTLAGLVIIAVIVVATFMYGNAQRQNQLKHDQQVKEQQQAKANPSTSAKPSATAGSSAAPSSGGVAATQAPVKSPTSNSIQGSASQPTKSPQTAASPAAAPATDGQVAGAQTSNIPTTGGSGTALPQTGSPLAGVLGFAAVVVAWLALRRSKRALFNAARR